MNKPGRFFLGIDIGTTSVSAALVDLQDGSNLLTRTQVHNAELPKDVPEANLQDPEVLMSTVSNLLKEIQKQHSQIDAIGITGQMHGIVPVNNAGKATGPAYTWLDGRAIKFLDRMESDVGKRVPVGYGAATLYTLLQTNLNAQTVGVADVPGWIAARLVRTDRMKISASQAHSLGLFSMDSLQFQTELWSRLGGIAPPEIVPSCTVIGETEGGMPVCVPEGDNQSGFIASVCDPDISVAINIGTSSQISLIKPRLSAHAPLLEERPLPGGQVLLTGAGLAGGKSFDPLTALVREVAEKYGFGNVNPWTVLDNLEKPATQLKVDARFAGSRKDPSVSGTITGIDFNNFTLAHLYWGIGESIVNELIEMLGAYSRIFHSPESYLVAVGNALEKNNALQTMFSSRTGRPIRQLMDTEATARGAAMIAAATMAGGIEKLPAIQSTAVRYRGLI